MSSEKKWTPGPWETDGAHHDQPYMPYIIWAQGAHGRVICAVWQDDAPVPDYNAEQIANAHLITAAPELYDALEALLDVCHAEPHGHDERQVARAALAKARGEQP